MAYERSKITIAIACLSGAVLLGTLLFVWIRFGQQMFHAGGQSLVTIAAVVLFGLVCYVIMAAFLAMLLGAFVFDHFNTKSHHEYEAV